VNGEAARPKDAQPTTSGGDADADVVGSPQRLHHRDDSWQKSHRGVTRVVDEDPVSDSQGVPLEPPHGVTPRGRSRFTVSDVSGPNRAARQGGHSHHSGSAVACNAGSPGKLWRHRPHWRDLGGSPTIVACLAVVASLGMTLLARIRERRRACVRGRPPNRPSRPNEASLPDVHFNDTALGGESTPHHREPAGTARPWPGGRNTT
jgi:hypothetical protein